MTRRQGFKSVGLLVWSCLIGSTAQAASIGMLLSSDVVEQGSTVQVSVFGSDFDLGVDGGDFSVSWSGNLAFVGISIPDPPWDVQAWDAANAENGFLSFVDVFSSFETPGLGGGAFDIATIVLQASSPGPGYVSLGPADVGWSVLGEGIADVQYQAEAALEIVAVPEPGSALLLGPYIALVLLARSRRSQQR